MFFLKTNQYMHQKVWADHSWMASLLLPIILSCSQIQEKQDTLFESISMSTIIGCRTHGAMWQCCIYFISLYTFEPHLLFFNFINRALKNKYAKSSRKAFLKPCLLEFRKLWFSSLNCRWWIVFLLTAGGGIDFRKNGFKHWVRFFCDNQT